MMCKTLPGKNNRRLREATQPDKTIMKIKLRRLLLTLTLLALSTLNSQLSTAFAQGTAFTYQGRLNSGTNPANGIYDLKLLLYDASTGGSILAGPVTNTAVAVTNGLFTMIIDFGNGVFTGSSNWLHIGVRTNGSGAFTVLTPRQQVTPTPYAIFAESANAAGLSGTIPTGDLSGTYGNAVTLNNAGNSFTGTFNGNGSGLTGVALLAGGNTFSGNQTIDGMLKIYDGSGAGYYTDETIGPGGYYSGEKHSINFDDGAGHIGSLVFGYNGSVGYFNVGNLYDGTHETNTTALTVLGNRTVGIGTTAAPQQYLSVQGGVNIDQANYNAGFINNGNTNGYGITFGSGSGEGIASQRTTGLNQYGLDFYTGFAHQMSILQGGNVGIGTTNPASKLEVAGDVRIDGNSLWLCPEGTRAMGCNMSVGCPEIFPEEQARFFLAGMAEHWAVLVQPRFLSVGTSSAMSGSATTARWPP